MTLNDFVGKEVQIYPNDTNWKFGVIEEISDKGFLVRITRVQTCYNENSYKVGDIYFISHSSPFRFKVSK